MADRDEWKRRCKAEYILAGVDAALALRAAEDTTAAVFDDGTADDYSPEDAARDDMECWDD